MIATSRPARAGLEDYLSAEAQVLHLSGVRAVIRMFVDVLRADRSMGRTTAGFVSGYQGSPLAGLDQELQRVLGRELGIEIVHRPAVNEELAVTAVMGSQLAPTLDSCRVDGVTGLWYGKAPGLDRSVDAFRHASYAGAHPMGGAVALVGDDPDAKSSTLPSASEGVLADLGIPLMFPKSLSEILELGQHAVALSRWSGAWTALKLVTSVADAEGTATVHPPLHPLLPPGYVAPPVSGDLLTPATTAREPVVLTERLAAAARYGDSNKLNRITVDAPRAGLAVVAAGTTYRELLGGLSLLGLDEPLLRQLGIRLAEVRMPFPLGAEFARSVAEGVREVLVIEERRELVEHQLLGLVGRRGDRTSVIGRFDHQNRPLIPRHGTLDAGAIANAVEPLLRSRFGDRVPPRKVGRQRIAVTAGAERVPWFCSGCPHSTSTMVPDGTLLGEGIGCHSIVHYMPEERVGHSIGITQMGGEGAQWLGMAPFVSDRHIVQNLGDGTFFHSGQLAVRAAVASGVSVTYKILWNGATAMTGGQDVVGTFGSAVMLAEALLLEGVRQVVITTDDLSRYRRLRLPRRVSVRDRRDVVAVQRELARVDGVTVMIHDQPCATELRRARKRGLVPSPRYRVVINERVCEGCGDCQTKSNCLSLQTVDTAFGPKTRIDGESCNIDLSCLDGDCPAFTLVPADDRRESAVPPAPIADRATPVRYGRPSPPDIAGAVTVRIAGIGGTGVVTAAHLLARAALLDGLEVWGLDQTGMAQKAGPVISDLRIGPGATEHPNRLGEGQTDLLLAADLMTAVGPSVLDSLSPERTVLVGSTTPTLSGPMVLGVVPRKVPGPGLQDLLRRSVRPGRSTFVDCVELAHAVGASASTANVVLLGVASGLGELPVAPDSLLRAIEINGVAVKANVAAFEAGRAWAGLSCTASPVSGIPAGTSTWPYSLPDLYRPRIEALAEDLVGYQNRRLASEFLELVSRAWEAEAPIGGDGRFAFTVAAGFHKLLAYKDEYEVARLLLEHPASEAPTTWLLHPPMLRAVGLRRKLRLGPWCRPVLATLRRARGLRGRWIDPFGRSRLRGEERRLPGEYATAIRSLLPVLTSALLDEAIDLAALPDRVRGFESIKERAITLYRAELATRMEAFERAASALRA